MSVHARLCIRACTAVTLECTREYESECALYVTINTHPASRRRGGSSTYVGAVACCPVPDVCAALLSSVNVCVFACVRVCVCVCACV